MKLKHKLTSLVFVAFILAAPMFGAIVPVLGAGEAEAAAISGFEYSEALGGTFEGDFGIICSGSSCPDKDEDQYGYKAGSKYTFDALPTTSAGDIGDLLGGSCGGTITVKDASHPEKGLYSDTCGHKNESIAIGNVGVFNQFMKDGGAASKGGPVRVRVNVDFGTVDDSISLVGNNLSVVVRCNSANKDDSVCNNANLGGASLSASTAQDKLTKNPVPYTLTISSGLKPGHKYKVCFSAAFLNGADGTNGKELCTKMFTEKVAGQSLTLDARGSTDELDDSSEDGTDGDPTCESHAIELGWILCPIITGMQNAIGGIFDNFVKPLLQTTPITTRNSTGNQIYKAWSNFRIYGNIFLVIALIVIVFGESIGGGLIDAYTAKKVLPRLLLAAILINTSYYIVGVLVDITNVVGNGLMTLITAPFGLTGDFSIDIGHAGSITLTAMLTTAVVWTVVSVGTSGGFLAWLWFVVLLPLLLIMAGILAVVLIRRALILFLVIVAPLAFALYCLPNTEKYFKKWWEILVQTLLVYPIIAALFAMGKVSAYLISQSGDDSTWVVGGLADVMAVIALMVPLALIPFAFKIAGGLLGQAYAFASGARQRSKIGEASREAIRARGKINRIQSREKYYDKLQKQGGKGNALRRNTIGRGAMLAGGLMGHNIQAETSAARAEVMKQVNDMIATGKDGEARGLSVNKAWALKHGKEGEDWRTDENGRRQFRSAAGAWVDEGDVDRAHARWGKNTFAQQAALSYEMRKANTEEETQRIGKMYRIISQGKDTAGNNVGGGWGNNDDQAAGTWIGAAFERQGEHLEFKSTDWKTGTLAVDSGPKGTALKDAEGKVIEGTGLRGKGLVTEAYEKKGSYALSQMGSNTIEQLRDSWRSADNMIKGVDSAGNKVTYTATQLDDARKHQAKIQAIAETFMSRYGGGSGRQMGEIEGRPIMDDNAIRQAAQAAAAASGAAPGSAQAQQIVDQTTSNLQATYQTNSQGAGHVAQRVREFAVEVGVYRPLDPSTDIHSAGPAPTIPREN